MIDNAKIPFVPESWECLLVKDAIDKISLTNRKLKQKEYLKEGKLPVVDQGQELIGGYTNNEEMKITSESQLIIFGDHTRVFKYIPFDFVAGADGVIVLKSKRMYLSKLLFYILQGARLPNKGYARHFQYLEKSYIPLPPLPEQHRIVAKIEELFTKLDAGVDALKQVQAQLKRYRQSVLKAAVEGKLTAAWREQHLDELEPADKLLDRIQSERKAKLGEKYKEPASINTTNLPDLPKGWVWTNVDSAFDITLGQSPPSSTYNKNGEGLPFFQGKAEFGNIYPTKKKWCNSPKKIAQKGSILISVRAPVGPTNIAPDTCCIGRGLAAIKGLGGVHTKFILYIFRAFEHKFSSKGTGTTFKAITGNQLKKVIIPFPPLIEQNNIVIKIEQILSNIEGAETVLESELKRAQSLRQSILKRVFEGKLVPQDPNDEPASVLLERIKAEKAKPKKSKQMEIF